MGRSNTSFKWRVLKLLSFGLVLLVLGLAAVFVGLCYQQALRLARPENIVAQQTPADYGITNWREVSFQASDGIQLNGWFIPPADDSGAAVLFVHGMHGNREQVWQQARFVAENGYGILVFDLRGSGSSGGEFTSLGYWEALDVQTAYAFLAARPEIDAQRIAIFGASMGGATAIRAVRQLPETAGLIIEASYASALSFLSDGISARTGLPPFPFTHMILWLAGHESGADLFDVDSERDLAQMHIPVLIIHGTADDIVPVAHGERLYAAANEPKTLLIIDGAGHGGLLEFDPQSYGAYLLPFLEQALGGD